MEEIAVGLTGTARMVVGTSDTAARVGSGRISVLATPRMVSLMEEAALDAIEARLGPGLQSLGTRLDVSHVAATPEGMTVTACAEVVAVEGREIAFRVEARDEAELIGEGTHRRVVVEADRFRRRIAAKAAAKG